MMHTPSTLLAPVILLTVGWLITGCRTPAAEPALRLTHEQSQQVCEAKRREQPAPDWDKLYQLQGVYCYDYERPDNGLDSGSPHLMILLPQYAGKYHYGVTVIEIFQDHYLEDPEMECALNLELRNNTLLSQDNQYTLTFKHDSTGKVTGVIKKYKDDPTEYHFRKSIGHRDFR